MHRDIKPSNILINSRGSIKLCDFGVSGELVNSIADTFVGTSTYMAPERIQGEKYTVKSDVWSFGLTIMELAIGKFPFNSNEHIDEDDSGPAGILDLLQQIVNEPAPKLPKSDAFPSILEDMIQKCLFKEPEKRPTPQELFVSFLFDFYNSLLRLLTLLFFLRSEILLFRLPSGRRWISRRGLSASWRKTTASLILYPRCLPVVPRICFDPATHRRGREITRSQPMLPSTVKSRLLELASSHRKIECPYKIDHPREMALPPADLLIRASDSEGPPPIPFPRPLLTPTHLTFQSDQRRQQAPSRRKEHRKSPCQQTKCEVRAEGSPNLVCPPTPILHMAYRIRHHTIDLSDYHVSLHLLTDFCLSIMAAHLTFDGILFLLRFSPFRGAE